MSSSTCPPQRSPRRRWPASWGRHWRCRARAWSRSPRRSPLRPSMYASVTKGPCGSLSVEVRDRSSSLQKKKGTEMVPPKLNLVPQRPEPEEAREDADGTEPATDASEVLAHEGWRGLPPNVGRLPSADRRDQLRILEALLFAASEPLAEQYLRGHLGSADD